MYLRIDLLSDDKSKSETTMIDWMICRLNYTRIVTYWIHCVCVYCKSTVFAVNQTVFAASQIVFDVSKPTELSKFSASHELSK